MTEPASLRIARVRKPMGLRGEVRVEPLTDNLERFRIGLEVRLREHVTAIEGVHRAGRDLALKLRGIDDLPAAESVRGEYLEVARENAEPLEAGHYYHWQLVGMTAVDPEGTELGEVSDVQEYPANDVIVVKRGGEELLVPAVKAVVKDVDLAGGRIVIDLPAEDEVR